MKRIGFVSGSNPFTDRKAWSGSIYKLREAIEGAGYEVKWIPLSISPVCRRLCSLLTKILHGRNISIAHTRWYNRLLVRSIKKEALADVDCLFFPGGAGLAHYMETSLPVIYFADTTFKLMTGYYSGFGDGNPWMIREGNYIEQLGHDVSSLIIRSSQWAANSSVNDYHSDPSKVFVLEFGPNLDIEDVKPITPYGGGKLRILFSGVEWQRKGGDVAIETVEYLREQGVDAELHICGIRELPCQHCGKEYVINHGFLNKNIPEQYAQYVSIVENSHLLLFPSKAECAGIVLSEAAAYGMPVWCYDTGGIPNYVINGQNGYRLPLDSTGKDFGEAILRSIRNGEMQRLHDGALTLSKEKLNYAAWSRRFREMVEKNIKINSKKAGL